MTEKNTTNSNDKNWAWNPYGDLNIMRQNNKNSKMKFLEPFIYDFDG